MKKKFRDPSFFLKRKLSEEREKLVCAGFKIALKMLKTGFGHKMATTLFKVVPDFTVLQEFFNIEQNDL